KIMEENNYYPFGLKHANYNMSQKAYIKAGSGVGMQPPCVGCPLSFKYNYKYQGQERQDELGLNWDSFKWRNYDYAIGRFMSIDPLSEDYRYNSPYAFQENKMGMGRELEGLELTSPWLNIMASEPPMSTSTLMSTARSTIEVTGKTSETVSKYSESTLENFSRGRNTETEQLANSGLEKNTKPVTQVDPKTGKEGTTVPDAIKPDGGTVEIKDVKNQSLTRQLRLQKAESESNGVKPELIINQSAKLSEPLKKAGFEIKTYQNNTVIESTGTSRRPLPLPEPKPKTDPNML
ncbi:putative toxin, partial [Flavobacterium sp.]|uniref:putative toxin n=1 Tax=Flavobacterium sp. TaxID=239 RepID=UPI003D6A3FDD